MQVEIQPGGRLVATRYVKGNRVRRTVTKRWPSYLFEHATLAPEATLRDVFRVLAHHPAFVAALWGRVAQERVAEALGMPRRRSPARYDPAGIEYLEVRRYIEVHGRAEEVAAYTSVWVDCGGMGWKLRKAHEGWKRGARIPWSLRLTPLATLVDLPVRLGPDLTVLDWRGPRKRRTVKEQRYPGVEFHLADVCGAILGELFNWGPSSRFRTLRGRAVVTPPPHRW